MNQEDIRKLGEIYKADPSHIEKLVQAYNQLDKAHQNITEPIRNELSMDIRDKQLMIRKWIRENPEAFKKFLKEEYRYVYKMNKVSKKAAKVVTVIFTGIIIYGIYEALAMFLPFNLPRFLPQLQSILQG